MNKIKLAILALMTTGLTACGTTGLPPLVTNKPAPVARPQIPEMDLGEIHWSVRDLAGLKALVRDMEAKGQTNVVFYMLSQDDYNTLAMNLAEMKRFIADQKSANDFLWTAIQINAAKVPTE